MTVMFDNKGNPLEYYFDINIKNITQKGNARTIDLCEQPEIYICGGTKFLHSIINSLKELNYDMNHVHFETFIPRLSVQV